MNEVLGALEVLGSFLGLPALVLAIVTWALKSRSDREMETIRTESNRGIALLTSELQRVSNESKTKFDWLHKKRASAIIELFGALVELDRATLSLLSPMTFGDAEQQKKQIEGRWKRVNEAGNNYRALYPKRAIFFKDELLEEFSKLDDLYWQKYVTVSIFGDYKTQVDVEQMMKAMDHSKVRAYTTSIKGSLQKLLGVID